MSIKRQRVSGKIIVSSGALAALSLAASRASAQSLQVFTQWNFDQIGVQATNSPAPTIGTGVAKGLGMTNNYALSDGNTFSIEADDVLGGNPLDPSKATGPGITYAWRVRGAGGGGGNGWSNNAPQYTQGAEFDTDSTGKSGLVFSCDWFSTNQGIHDLQEQYTVNGTDWINVNPVQTSVPNGYLYGLNINFGALGITAVNNDPNFGVRLVSTYDPNHPEFGTSYSGGNGSVMYNNSSGNWRFANVTFSSTGTSTVTGDTTPVLTYAPPSTTWNSTNLNFKDSNGATVSFGGTSTIAAFTDAPLPFATSTATVTVVSGGIGSAGVNVSNTNGTYTFTGGSISGGALTKTGGGNLVLQSANSFRGLNVFGGTVHTAADANLGAATSRITISGGTLVADAALNIAHNVQIGTNGGSISSAFPVTNSGSFTVSGKFVKNDIGDLNFAGNVTTNPGATLKIAGGNVIFSGTSAVSIISTPTTPNTFAGNIIVANGKGLAIEGGNIDGPGDIELQVNGTAFKADSATGTTLTTVNMPIKANSLNQPGPFTVAVGASGVGDIMILNSGAVISGNSSVVFAGGNSGGKATLIINSQSTYTGDTIINNDAAGLTKLGVDNAFPVASNFAFGDGSNKTSIGALDLNGHNQQLGSIATYLPGGTNFISQFANGITNSSANPSTLTISGTATTTFSAIIGTPTGVILNGGVPQNNIALTLGASNTGTLILQGQNSYTGLTTVNGGTLQIDAAQNTIGTNTQSSLPSGNNIANNASLIVNSPSTLVGSLSGSGVTTVSGTSLTYIGTLNTPALTVNTVAQGALVNSSTMAIVGGGTVTGDVSGSGIYNVGAGSSATLTVGSLHVDGTLNVADGSSVNIVANPSARVTHTVGTLNLNAGGTLDLANHALLTTTTDNVRAYVARAAGPVLPTNGLNAWTGPGLTSSLVKADAANSNARQLAVGYFDSRDNAQTGLSVPTGKTLVQYTVYGDATGDSKVDIADLSVWNNNFGAGNRWSQGDWNYDGKIDISDLSVWNNDFGNQLTGGTIKPGVRAAGAVAAASSAVAGHATPTLTSSASASASPAATPLPATLELDVNTATGDATLNSGGVTLAAIELDSASGILLKSGWQSLRLGHGFNQWSFPRGTPSATSLSEYTSDASSASGQPATLAAGTLTDYGLIFPVGFSDPTDLTFKYNIADPTTGLTAPRTGTVVFTSGVPEPTCLALGGVAAMGLLSRKRRKAN